jgi:hypothetical protein
LGAANEAPEKQEMMPESFMVIEWFQYHSVKFKVPKETFESQEYAFQLAKDMLTRRTKPWIGRILTLDDGHDRGCGGRLPT